MSEPRSSSVAPVATVVKRAGQTQPFDAAKISQSIYCASEELGRGDAFLARELTDGILHFLALDFPGQSPTTEQIRELVSKVIREFGHPELARTYSDCRRTAASIARNRSSALSAIKGKAFAEEVREELFAPIPASAASLGNVVLEHFGPARVFKRDLLAAQADGLLVLGTPASSLALSAATVPVRKNPLEQLAEIDAYGRLTGDALIFDSPDYFLAETDVPPWLQVLSQCARDGYCQAIINLNSSEPPAEAVELASGPLFAGSSLPQPVSTRAGIAQSITRNLANSPAGIRVIWHLAEPAFAEDRRSELVAICDWALATGRLTFAYDRPRRAVALGEGVDRVHPGTILGCGVNLHQLAQQMGAPRTAERFLSKLVSLARLVLSAGVQKRAVLRDYGPHWPILQQAFLLERSRLVLVPIGLGSAVRDLLGNADLASDPQALDLACKILARLRQCLTEDGKAHLLESCLDSPAGLTRWIAKKFSGAETHPLPFGRQDLDRSAWAKHLIAAGSLQRAAGGGTARLAIEPGHSLDARELADLLRFGWTKTDIICLEVVRSEI